MGADFNGLPRLDERIGGDQVLANEIDDFANCISHCALQETKYKGLAYTWSNKQGPTKVFSELDRVFLNGDTIQVFANAEYEVLHEGVSNHSPLLVTLQQ